MSDYGECIPFPDRVWLIVRDHGYDGLAEPFRAFLNEESARRAYALLQEFDTYSIRLVEAPVGLPPLPESPR